MRRISSKCWIVNANHRKNVELESGLGIGSTFLRWPPSQDVATKAAISPGSKNQSGDPYVKPLEYLILKDHVKSCQILRYESFTMIRSAGLRSTVCLCCFSDQALHHLEVGSHMAVKQMHVIDMKRLDDSMLKVSSNATKTLKTLNAICSDSNKSFSLFWNPEWQLLHPLFQLFELRLWRGFVAFQLSQVHNASVKSRSDFASLSTAPNPHSGGTTARLSTSFSSTSKRSVFFVHRQRRKYTHHAASASLCGASGSNGSELIGSGVSRAVLPKRAPAASSVAASWANSARSFPRRSASLFDLSWEDVITVQ